MVYDYFGIILYRWICVYFYDFLYFIFRYIYKGFIYMLEYRLNNFYIKIVYDKINIEYYLL